MEIRAQRKDGSQFPVEIGLSTIETHSGTLVMSFVIDITQRKQVEVELREALKQQQELNELKTRFVSMASHEFRTPLATILATTETLTAYRQKIDDAQIDRRLGKIRDQVNHLQDIINDVLQLARIQAGRSEFMPTQVDFDEFCRDIIDEFQNRPDISHDLIYRCSTPLLSAQIDKKLMRQALSNLITNAIKYSPQGKTVWVDVTGHDNSLVVKVRDEGIGIPEEDQKHLFEAFHRATNVGTISGTGLGLAITAEAVVLHGGRITLESQLNQGTTFILTIPQNG